MSQLLTLTAKFLPNLGLKPLTSRLQVRHRRRIDQATDVGGMMKSQHLN